MVNKNVRQRVILEQIALDFARDGQGQEAYLDAKISQIKEAIVAYEKLAGTHGFILGLSGGIDSFVCGALVADAIEGSSSKIHLLMLPNCVQKDIDDSIACAQVLKEQFSCVEVETVSIENGYLGVIKDLKQSKLYDKNNRYALGNVQARLRMVEQYALNAGLLVIGTDHAAENMVGYFTKFGDGASDFNPIDGLVKEDIYQIARRYQAPSCVLEKQPAAGLGISENDEAELKVSYQQLSAFLKGNPLEEEQVDRIAHLFQGSMHKRNLAASPMNLWWKDVPKPVCHVVVDGVYGFIDGGLACQNAQEALDYTVAYINAQPQNYVLYVKEQHPEGHCSFQSAGGIWPAHAVQGTRESELYRPFYEEIKKTIQTPISRYNVFIKGDKKEVEEYSGFEARNPQYGMLKDNLVEDVVVSGIATEYCIKNTVLDLLQSGHNVFLLAQGLGYVEREGHVKTLEELEKQGVHVLY